MCVCVYLERVLYVHKPVWDTAAYHSYLKSSGGKPRGHESSREKTWQQYFAEFFSMLSKESIAVSTLRFRDGLSTHLKRIRIIFQGLKHLWGLFVYVRLSIKMV